MSTCRDCRDIGVNVTATRILPSGTAVCTDHYRKRLGMPAATISPSPNEKEAAKMPQPVNIDWAKVQADRDAGMKVAEIAKKYGVHPSTIYLHAKKGNAARVAPPSTPRPATAGRQL